MSSRLFVIAVCAALIGSGAVAQAQSGRGGGRGRGGGGSGFPARGSEAPKALNEDDLAKADPARVLLDRAKDLKLTDGEKQALDTVAKRFDWNTRLFAKDVDSLSTAMRAQARLRVSTGSAVDDSAEAGAESATRRRLAEAIQSIRDEFKTDSSSALQKLDESQRKAAEPLLGDARSKLDGLLVAAGSSGSARRGRE